MKRMDSASIGIALLLTGTLAFVFIVSRPAASPRGEVPLVGMAANRDQSAVLLRGDRGLIPAYRTAFVWCESGSTAGAQIVIGGGHTEIYAFEGYEYALLSMGAKNFPGKRSVLDDGAWIEHDVDSIRPRTLYHIFSTVPLHLECTGSLTDTPH